MSSAALRVSHQPEREGGANGSAGAAWTGGGTWRGRSGWTGTPPHGSAGWSPGPRRCCGKTVIVDLVATRDDPGGFLNERSNPEAPSLLCVALSRARTSLAILAEHPGLPGSGFASRVLAARQAGAA